MKQIITWFKQSVNASDELRKAQDPDNMKKLIQEVSTRWNLTYYSITRFLELRDIINQIVNRHSSAPGMINAREAEELKEVQDILLPLETATKQLSGEKYTTSSIVIPMIFNIKKKIEGSTPKYEIGKKLKESLLGECNKRFGMAEQVHLLSVSTLLDPRFKKMYFTSPLDCVKAVQNIQEELQLKMDVSQQSFSIVNEQKEKEPAIPEVFDLWEDHSRLISENTKEISTSAPSSELSLYLKSSVLSIKVEPIKWWEENKATYPNLAIIAHKYLAVVATSVPSERLFSKAGQTVTQQRNRIKGKLLSKLLFLQDIDKHYWGL
ncbi:E3 SUMO-protein ligase ZBED1-like [Diabrotica undecimpunctata]|uniref:E3 SUMO-protein ligase ZBED1-like n=1 Tax=Diabrotica undecimpunctata TaxID=50387 RepID=UPI003B63EEB9